MPYTCEWERPDSPTKTLGQDAMLKYYKDRSVAGWCRFYLDNPGEESPELRAAIQTLADSCQTKQKPAHKVERDRLARRWQAEAAARSTRDVAALTPYQGGHLVMHGWADGRELAQAA